jgi:predicted GNAT family N-acyltransferase
LPDEGPAPKIRFALLGPAYDRAGFSCGVPALDSYLQKQAGLDVRRRVAVAFVATPDGKTIAGYYTLSHYSVDLDILPDEFAGKLPRYPLVPATLIGRLAVSTAFRGLSIGELLLMDALYCCLSGGRKVASAAVIVDAKDEGVAAFYRKYGFLELPKVTRRMFLPMATVEALFG